ncbi:ATP-binding cassette domain-containing protein [Virgibacillus sp. C22-A2]|uniref:ATP-binding cassette domain-containing protein n=1 Tax=Virgibacillus tibetensis TaxID=3042313 RepID=A0ABU6KIE3_9BACI|nr:ATP-binding cassette domain-containing protein [Virgibacillus sp. C22-A2]
MLSVTLLKKLQKFSIDVSFDIKKEIVILFGPSGSGKTSILNNVAGITSPDKGSIRLNNRMLFHEKEKPVPIQKRNIGYLFQNYALFPHMTVGKNITYAMKDEALVNQLVSTVGLEHLLTSYPHQISGGEKQRVALVRALATKPEALLLDEPFSSLDDKTRIQCQNELLRLHELWKIPVIMVTHDYEEAEKLGDRIVKLENGKIV